MLYRQELPQGWVTNDQISVASAADNSSVCRLAAVD